MHAKALKLFRLANRRGIGLRRQQRNLLAFKRAAEYHAHDGGNASARGADIEGSIPLTDRSTSPLVVNLQQIGIKDHLSGFEPEEGDGPRSDPEDLAHDRD